MRPAFSLIFFTVFIGLAQGLFLLAYSSKLLYFLGYIDIEIPSELFFKINSLTLMLLLMGTFASIFHLGKPSRAWMAIKQWRTSWLSREVIALVLLIFLISVLLVLGLFADKFIFFKNENRLDKIENVVVGWAVFVALFLFLSTGMVYASIKTIREWNSSLVVLNFLVFGLASGAILIVFVVFLFDSSGFLEIYVPVSFLLIISSGVSHILLELRNKRLIEVSLFGGVLSDSKIKLRQILNGVPSSSYNIQEFSHKQSPLKVYSTIFFFNAAVFFIPIIFISLGMILQHWVLFAFSVLSHFMGLLAGRWLFFVRARHSQNSYYQSREFSFSDNPQ